MIFSMMNEYIEVELRYSVGNLKSEHFGSMKHLQRSDLQKRRTDLNTRLIIPKEGDKLTA
jgi:hypothetical protein